MTTGRAILDADVTEQQWQRTVMEAAAYGHIGPLRIDEGRALWIEPLLFGAARLHIGRPGPGGAPEDGGYDDSWDYRTLAGAMRAAAWWMIDPTAPEPTGWYRHQRTGRRRVRRRQPWTMTSG